MRKPWVQEELGLETQELASHLHDLLVYEPGSHFLPHRDGEKLDRMVATLVVALPSTYEGGELVVRHEGIERTIDFRGPDANPFHIHFAAFYADCEHEVRPLRKGYRLCLVYNLTLAKSKKVIVAPRESEHVARIARLLREWSEDDSDDSDDSAGKLTITLDHQYTEKGLTPDMLKGTDRAKVRILQEAARQADCKAYLALLTFHESGSADYTGGGRRSGSGRGRGWGRGRYDEYGSGDADDYEMGEVYESSLTATPWSDGDGNTLPIGELSVEEDELLDPEALRGIDPEEEFEGYTGNAGMTLDHWYRHAAILLWPTRRHFEILCDHDGRNAVPELERMVTQWRRSEPSEAAALKAQCVDLARAILTTWSEQHHGLPHPETSKSAGLLEALATLGDPTLIGGFLGDLLTKDVTLEPGKALVAVCETHGWKSFEKELRAVMESTSNNTMERNVRLLEHICSARPRKKAGWSELCTTLSQALVTAVERADRGRSQDDWRTRRVDRGEVLAGLARSLILAGEGDLLSRVVAHALSAPKTYPHQSAHMPALASLRPWLAKNVKTPLPALTTWLSACREQLESLTAKAPEAPKTFQRAAEIDCKCQDCAELKTFLKDPGESSHRFSMRQDRRDHLANNIRQHKSDLDLRTETRGSPHTLICTKNTASFQERTKTYHQDLEHLATVQAIKGQLPG